MCTGAASHISLHLHLLSCRICHAGNIYCAHSGAAGDVQNDGMGESERQHLASEAHKAAREVESKNIMAANKSGGDTRDSLRKANPPAVKAGPA